MKSPIPQVVSWLQTWLRLWEARTLSLPRRRPWFEVEEKDLQAVLPRLIRPRE